MSQHATSSIRWPCQQRCPQAIRAIHPVIAHTACKGATPVRQSLERFEAFPFYSADLQLGLVKDFQRFTTHTCTRHPTPKSFTQVTL